MDEIYNCLDVQKLYEICKALNTARNVIFLEHGKSVISSVQYQDLIHVLHDVSSCLAENCVNECKYLEGHYENNKFA